MQRLAVIIPTYNDHKNLPVLIASLEENLGGMNVNSLVVIVDDDSPAGTGMVAEQLGNQYGNIWACIEKGK